MFSLRLIRALATQPIRPIVLATRRIVFPLHSKRLVQPRQYATKPPPDVPNVEFSPEMWIEVLENTASAPWLGLISQDHEDRLRRAYSLLFQIVMYLGRPQSPKQAAIEIDTFESAYAPPGSEMWRARRAVAVLLRTAVQNMSSIPLDSPLRTKYTDVFDVFSALQTLHDVHLTNPTGKVADWSSFWEHAQPVMLHLGMKLDEAGFGLKNDQK